MAKGKLLVGPILTLLGGLIFLFSAYMTYTYIAVLEADLTFAGLSWEDVGFNPIFLYFRVFFTTLWGIIGIIGAILRFKGKRFGSILALIGGMLGIIGMFVPLGTILSVPIALSTSLYIDPALMIIGGILGLVLKE